MTTRTERMNWCKKRALDYLDRGDVQKAFASMSSDVTEHAETDNPTVRTLLATVGMYYALNNDVQGMRRFIEDFN